jgi:hypothetical protein
MINLILYSVGYLYAKFMAFIRPCLNRRIVNEFTDKHMYKVNTHTLLIESTEKKLRQSKKWLAYVRKMINIRHPNNFLTTDKSEFE